MKIAIIGSGAAGLAAAWRLNEQHDITVYEAANYVGGHACTRDFTYNDQTVPVDMGLLIFLDSYYPNLDQLLEILDVPSQLHPFTVSIFNDQDGWSNSNHKSMMWGMVAQEVVRFNLSTSEISALNDTISIKQYLDEKGYSEAFRQFALIPMLSVIYVTRKGLLDIPARDVGIFFAFAGMSFTVPTMWRVFTNGSREYTTKLSALFADKIRLNTAVTKITRDNDKVTILDKNNNAESYDQVVMATSAWNALALLSDASELERTLLGAVKFEKARVVLHSDERVMPANKKLWSFFNFKTDGVEKPIMTYHWQRPDQLPIFITIDPSQETVAPDKIITELHWEHSIGDTNLVQIQKQLHAIQGNNRTWFCGAHLAVPAYHEAAFCSGLVIANKLGADYPFAQNPFAYMKFLEIANIMFPGLNSNS